MSRNVLYIIIAVLVIAVAYLGWQYYESQQTTSRVEIKMNDGGFSIETN